MKLGFLLFVVFFGLIGCSSSPEKLGFTKEEWQKMPVSQQQDILQKHRKIQWTSPEHEVNDIPADLKFNMVKLKLIKGKARFGKQRKKLAFKPVSFSLSNNSCYNVRLLAVSQKIQSQIKFCYANYRVSIDPSPWDLPYRQGSAFVYSSYFWHRGFLYENIKTKGVAKLSNASLYIQAG